MAAVAFSLLQFQRKILYLKMPNVPMSLLGMSQIHLPHLRIRKYFTKNSSVNFHDKVFLHILPNLAKIEEKPCHGNLRMCH